MAWNFRRSIKLGPVRVNLSRSGVGASIGVKGYRKGIDANGREYTHTSIPGTGIYNRSYNKKPRLDDADLNSNEYKRLNGTGRFAIALILGAFFFIWVAGESFWFAFVICAGAAVLSGAFSNQKMYDTYVRSDGSETDEIDTTKLEEELARLEALEESESHSPFAVFGLNEDCSRKDLDRAFRNKIKLYHPDKLENLGPELKDLGQQKSKEINEAYGECVKILQLQKSA